MDLPTAADTSIGIYFDPSASLGRTYTVRHCDRSGGLITVDVLLHGEGPGTSWAVGARRGDEVGIAHPGSRYRERPATDSQLLVCDMAGLPALARIIESVPQDADATAVVEVIDESDLDYLPQRTNVEVVTSVGTGNGVYATALIDLVTSIRDIARHSYCWFGGEAGSARAIRKYLRDELHWERGQFDALGYWRLNSEEWDRRYAAIGSRLFTAYQTALAEGMDERLAAEEYDVALEQAGL